MCRQAAEGDDLKRLDELGSCCRSAEGSAGCLSRNRFRRPAWVRLMFYTLAALILATGLAAAPGLLLAQELVGHWAFDAEDGARVTDNSGYGNHGQRVGDVTFPPGVQGTSIHLDGTGSHVVVPASPSLGELSAFSFAAWIKPGDNSSRYILAKDKRDAFLTLGGWGNYLRGCVRVRVLICSATFNGALESDKWTFVVMTYDDGADKQVHLYIDGEEVDYREQDVAPPGDSLELDPGAPVAIGAMPVTGNQVFFGQIDEVRVFSGALSGSQVRSLFEGDLGAPDVDRVPPLVRITDPAVSLLQTREPTIDLVGTATDKHQIAEVFWNTDRGEAGRAEGGSVWAVSDLPLHPNSNLIEVTAIDTAGNAGFASMQVIQSTASESDFEGFGAGTTGGSGHRVYTVVSAANLDAVLDEVNARGGQATISLSGSWEYGSNLRLVNVSDVTVDGTGANVVFRNASVIVRCSDNVIIRGLRVRNQHFGGDAIQIDSSQRVVVDHNSVSGAGDGNIDITGWSCGPSQHVTVSWNIFADTWKQSLIKYGGTTKVSLHHNLFFNSGNRLPAMQSEGEFDIRNNVFWQWASSGTALGLGSAANIVGNVYQAGTPARGHAAIWYLDDTSKAWIEGNLLPVEETDVSRLDAPLQIPPTTTHAADVALDLVVEGAGAWPRDPYDAEVIAAVEDGHFPAPPPFED